MFEFLLSIRGSFLAVRVGRMPRRCGATGISFTLSLGSVISEILFVQG